jgi:hypothetical protein
LGWSCSLRRLNGAALDFGWSVTAIAGRTALISGAPQLIGLEDVDQKG